MAAERDETTGRFMPGNGGNPNGRTHDQRAKLAAMLSVVSIEDVKSIITAQVKLAQKGNTKAAEFVCDRLFGKAAQAISLTGEDGKPALILREIVIERTA